MRVDLNELKKALAFIQLINSSALNEIEWYENDSRVFLPFNEEALNEWRFIGLSNVDFAGTHLLNKE